MNTDDLQKFLVIADTQNLQQAAEKLNSSPSALSKSLKKLENLFATQLFDRVGKQIQLNSAGELLRIKAAGLVSLAKQTQAEFAGLASNQTYRIAGPSILQFKWAPVLNRFLLDSQPNATVHYESAYEHQALERVVKGTADLALITTAVSPQMPDAIYSGELGSITLQVAAAKNHVLLKNKRKPRVSLNELLLHPFAAPSISPYCGQLRGVGCDGWKNELFPRKLQMITNDYGVLSQLVRSGQALAYLPDYWIREWKLTVLDVFDCPHLCVEKLLLVGWQKELIEGFINQ